MASLKPDVNKMERCKKSLLRDYFRTSIVEEAVDAIDYVEDVHRNLQFLEFGRWVYVPTNWFTDPCIYPDLAFEDVGRGIAIGEEKHIMQQILTNRQVNRIALEDVSYNSLKEIIDDLTLPREQDPRLVLFVPIEYFVTMHIDWAREQRQIVVQNDSLLMGNWRIKVFWSSKYVDFNDFIVARKSSCRWVVKPNVKNRLQVELYESKIEPENMELKAQTVFNFTIYNPQEIRVVHPPTIRSVEPPRDRP